MNDSDFWLNLYKEHPELFQVVRYQGKNILKIISFKLKEKYGEIKEKLKDKQLQNAIPVLHASESKKYLSLVDINQDEKNKIIRKYMTLEDWSIYMLGQKALIEKRAVNMDEVIKIKREAINLRGQRGRIFVNFALQSYFQELIIPLLQYQIGQLNSDSEVIKWFSDFLDRMVRFFPRAFWVKNSTTMFEIRKELIKRCVSHNFKSVNIHTIGQENIKKIEKILVEFASDESFPKFDYKLVDDIKELPAITFEITLK